MYKVWLERVDQEPTLLSSARKHGLTRLGYMSLKPEQLSAIDAILRGRDTFVSVPTGFGKSLVYQVLPFCADWLTGRVTGISTSSKPVVMVMVVSPLLLLMHDRLLRFVYAWRALSRITRVCTLQPPTVHEY